MNNLDLMLLSGSPITADQLGPIYQPTLLDIARIGELAYHKMVRVSTFTKKSLEIEDETFSDFKYLIAYTNEDQEFRETLMDAWSFFLRKKVDLIRHKDELAFQAEDGSLITDDNYLELVKILKLISCLDPLHTVAENPANDKARELLAKKKMLKQKVNQAKSADGGESLTLYDLISILASCSNSYNLIHSASNPMSVWQLTFYQFNDAFKRLKMFRDYEVNIQALLHGAKSEDIKLKHWISKLSDED